MKKYLLIFSLSFIPRFFYLLASFHSIVLDQSWYWRISGGFYRNAALSAAGFLNTHNEPLYALFLALGRWFTFDHPFAVMTAQVAVASAGAIYLYKLCLELANDASVGRIAVLLYSFYPYYIRQSAALSDTTLFTTLLIASVYDYSKEPRLKNFLFCGLSFGLTVLTRMVALPFCLLAVAVLFFKKHFTKAGIVAMSMFVIIAPSLYLNFIQTGSLVATRSGINLFKGNCAYTSKIVPYYGADLLQPYAFEVLARENPNVKDEGEVDRFFTRKALDFVKNHPLGALKMRAMNMYYLFYPRLVPFHSMNYDTKAIILGGGDLKVVNAPSRGLWSEYAYSVPYLFMLATGLIGLVLRRRQLTGGDLVLALAVLSLTLVYSIYWPATRLRAPLDFVLMFYSACALRRFTDIP